jgi:hypothetical protein
VFDPIAGEEGPEPLLRPVLVSGGNSDSLAAAAGQ